MIRRYYSGGVCMVTFIVASVGGVSAQEPVLTDDENSSVVERARPQFEAPGTPVGGFLIYPTIEYGTGYSDNIFATPDDTVSDTFLSGSAAVQARSNWGRHALNAAVGALGRSYFDRSDENYLNFFLNTNGRFDVSSEVSLGASAEVRKDTELRTGIASPAAAAEPVDYSTANVGGNIAYQSGRVKLRGETALKKLDFEDVQSESGAVIDQDFRDRDEISAKARGDVAFTADTWGFVELNLNENEYDDGSALSASRDSNGYNVLAGVAFDVTEVVRGEVGVGYEERSYDSSAFEDTDDWKARADISWFPTMLTTVSFSGARAVQDSVVPGSGGFVTSQVGVGVDHELRRNVILSGDVSYRDDNYTDIDRDDQIKVLALGVEYLMNRNVHVDARYRFTDRDSNGAAASAREFSVNSLGVSIKFSL